MKYEKGKLGDEKLKAAVTGIKKSVENNHE